MWGKRGSSSLAWERGQSPKPGIAGDKAPKPQTRQGIMFGWGGPQLVPLWSGEQMHREVRGPAKALE